MRASSAAVSGSWLGGAPAAPDVSISIFQSPCEAGCIAERRGGQPRPHAGSHLVKLRRVSSQFDSLLDIFGLAAFNQAAQPGVMHDGRSYPADEAVAAHGDDGDPHGQGFAGRGPTVIRKRIERNVDLRIETEYLWVGRGPEQVHPR